jgi:VanZ family protein
VGSSFEFTFRIGRRRFDVFGFRLVVALSYLAYEFAQLRLPGSTSDVSDVIASLVGAR